MGTRLVMFYLYLSSEFISSNAIIELWLSDGETPVGSLLEMDDELLFQIKTSDGYYIQISMLIMSSTSGGNYRILFGKNKITFIGHKEGDNGTKSESEIKNTERFYIDKELVGKEFRIYNTQNNNILLACAKKKDTAHLFIRKSDPMTLILDIADIAETNNNQLKYQLVEVESDIETVRPNNIKNLNNPNVVIDSGELTKSCKLLTKSCKVALCESQSHAIRIIPQSQMPGGGGIEPIVIGRWDRKKEVSKVNYLDIVSLKNVNKAFTLGKKVWLFSTPDGIVLKSFLPQGLGAFVIQFDNIKVNEREDSNTDDK